MGHDHLCAYFDCEVNGPCAGGVCAGHAPDPDPVGCVCPLIAHVREDERMSFDREKDYLAYDVGVEDERERIMGLLRQVHYPRRDPGYSLVSWEYCACGSSEVFTAGDGYPSIGPARYPCATLRALGVSDESEQAAAEEP